jgi:copper resistance protein C
MGAAVFRGWVVGLLATVALLVGAAPAGAHAELESSDPKDGATLAAAPAAITLTFGEQILSEGNAMTLTDVASGTRLDLGPVRVDGDTVSVSWPTSSPAGDFRAAYRVVSADGHPIDGTITFTVRQAVGEVEASAAAAPSASTSAGPSTNPAPVADDAGAGPLGWVLGIGLALLLGAVAGTWVMRRTR